MYVIYIKRKLDNATANFLTYNVSFSFSTLDKICITIFKGQCPFYSQVILRKYPKYFSPGTNTCFKKRLSSIHSCCSLTLGSCLLSEPGTLRQPEGRVSRGRMEGHPPAHRLLPVRPRHGALPIPKHVSTVLTLCFRMLKNNYFGEKGVSENKGCPKNMFCASKK